jgi:hypothetical protein
MWLDGYDKHTRNYGCHFAEIDTKPKYSQKEREKLSEPHEARKPKQESEPARLKEP